MPSPAPSASPTCSRPVSPSSVSATTAGGTGLGAGRTATSAWSRALPRLPGQGRLVVAGYLVTRRFAVWIGDGQSGQVTVEYDQREPAPRVKVIENPHGHPVRCLLTSPLQALHT